VTRSPGLVLCAAPPDVAADQRASCEHRVMLPMAYWEIERAFLQASGNTAGKVPRPRPKFRPPAEVPWQNSTEPLPCLPGGALGILRAIGRSARPSIPQHL
jgi:hypothetical protein